MWVKGVTSRKPSAGRKLFGSVTALITSISYQQGAGLTPLELRCTYKRVITIILPYRGISSAWNTNNVFKVSTYLATSLYPYERLPLDSTKCECFAIDCTIEALVVLCDLLSSLSEWRSLSMGPNIMSCNPRQCEILVQKVNQTA